MKRVEVAGESYPSMKRWKEKCVRVKGGRSTRAAKGNEGKECVHISEKRLME